MAQIRRSKQRDAILNFLKTRADHPSAEIIYENVKKTIPNISLGTVYRNLALLNGMGLTRTLYTDGGADHFDANMEPHDHFVCRNCHKIFDVPREEVDYGKVLSRAGIHGRIEDMSSYYSGLCEECLKKLINRET